MREQFEEAVYVYAEAIHDNAIMGEQNVTGDELRAMANRVASAQLALMAKFDAALQAATLAERERAEKFEVALQSVLQAINGRKQGWLSIAEYAGIIAKAHELLNQSAAIRSADEKEG